MTSELFDRNHPHDTRHALFHGRGACRVWSLVPEPAAPFAAVLACELEPSGIVGTHLQEYFPEIVVVISGAGSARVNGQPRELWPGAVIELPLGQTLALENTSADAPLRYLIIKAR